MTGVPPASGSFALAGYRDHEFAVLFRDQVSRIAGQAAVCILFFDRNIQFLSRF